MLKIATVLRSGGPYNSKWVRALRHGVARHLEEPHEFVCLTDQWRNGLGRDVHAVPLRYKWPGWWSKFELFRPGLFAADDAVVYFDLDTLVVGSLDPLVELAGRSDFGLLHDWFPPHLANTGVMVWRLGEKSERVWDVWRRGPGALMNRWRGDGELIREIVPDHDPLPDFLPESYISSYKEPRDEKRLKLRDSPPEGAHVICGHGAPRFSSIGARWAHDLWTEALES